MRKMTELHAKLLKDVFKPIETADRQVRDGNE
jgi:hypothetical protein